MNNDEPLGELDQELSQLINILRSRGKDLGCDKECFWEL